MKKRHFELTASVLVGLLLLAGAAIFLWRSNAAHSRSISVLGAAARNNDSSAPTQGVPAGGTGSTLPVSPVPAPNSLGQTAPSQTPAGSGGSDQAIPQIDPKTFGQYDKYKSDKSAYYIDLKAGDGAALTVNKKAAVYYVGWLTDGTEFDHSTVDAAGNPQDFNFTMGAHQVILGWEEATYGMKAGGVRLLIVPPAVGYGATAKGPIPANSVLIFEVQLLSVT